jgi:hypothetical protein
VKSKKWAGNRKLSGEIDVFDRSPVRESPIPDAISDFY